MITEVVSAIINNSRGDILLTLRNEKQSYPLCWELPGGKVEPGELRKAALKRELKEELGVVAQIGALVHKAVVKTENHTYEMYFYRVSVYFCDVKAGDEDGIQLLAGQLEKKWFDPARLHELQNMPSMTPELIAAIRNLFCPCCGSAVHALVQPTVEEDAILNCVRCADSNCARYQDAHAKTQGS